jgi:hypothetical protein
MNFKTPARDNSPDQRRSPSQSVDRARADYSTRTGWQQAAPSLLAPYLRRTMLGVEAVDQDQPASVSRPFAAWYEGLVRPMSLGAPLLASTADPVLMDLGEHGRIDLGVWYRQLFIDGTNPDNPQRWTLAPQNTDPALPPRNMDQTIVETAILAVCLNVARQQLWDPLPDNTKLRLAAWMDAVSRQMTRNVNNWNMFPIITQLGLRNLGCDWDRENTDRLLEQVERFYHGGGWYADGYYRQFDYYVPEAIYLQLIAAKWRGDDSLRQRIHERAAHFARDFALFFDREGRNICFGRSRSYRFAASYFFAMCGWCEVPGVDPGLCRSIVTRNIGWYLDKPIFAADGRIAGGHAYLNERMNEPYIGGGSCAWAFQSFLPLSLPEQHPFWTAAAPEPVRGIQRHLKQPNAMVTVSSNGQNATLFNGGIHHPFDFGNHASKYGKFAYSSHFGFNLADVSGGSADNMICLSPDEGQTWSHRIRFEICHDDGTSLTSRHQPFPWDPRTLVTTTLLVRDLWHLRIHQLVLDRPYLVRDGGTPVGTWGRGLFLEPQISKSGRSIILGGNNGCVGAWSLDGCSSPELGGPYLNANVLHRRVFVPLLTARLNAGTHTLTSAWYADTDPDAMTNPPVPPELQAISDGLWNISWPDGHTDSLQIPPPSESPLHIVTGGGFPWPLHTQTV